MYGALMFTGPGMTNEIPLKVLRSKIHESTYHVYIYIYVL